MPTLSELAARVWVALEGSTHVRAIRAVREDLASTTRLAVDLDMFDRRALAEAHYRLLRAMPRADAVTIAFFDSQCGDPVRWVSERHLRPSPEEIASARAAIAAFVPEANAELAVEPPRTLDVTPPRVAPGRPQALVLERDLAQRSLTARAVREVADVFAPEDEWELLDVLATGRWDVVFCDVAWRTPGDEPMHRLVRRVRPDLSAKIVLVSFEPPDVPSPRVLVRPVTVDAVREAVRLRSPSTDPKG